MVSGVLAAALVRITLDPSDRAIYAAEFAEADRLIAEVERFRAAHARPPNDMREVKFRSNVGVEYRRVGDEYWITFPAPKYGLFGTLKYDSTYRRWSQTD